MRFFKRMSQSPDFAGFSACLLSHSSRREVEDELDARRSLRIPQNLLPGPDLKPLYALR